MSTSTVHRPATARPAPHTTASTSRDRESIGVKLRDGSPADLRPMARGETFALEAVFAGMSPASRQSRYLVAMPLLPASYRRALSSVDGDLHVAWLGLVDGEPAAIARYVRLPPDHTAAEFAFEVVDRHHGRGLARLLLDAVTTVAAARGVRSMRATLAPGNWASRRLLATPERRLRVVDGLLELEAPLGPPSSPRLDPGRVVDLQNLYTGRALAEAH